MTKTLLLLTLALPLTGVAQEIRQAIIIEEETADLASEVAETVQTEAAEAVSAIDTVADEVLQDLLAQPAEEQLPEQPDDIKPEDPTEPVLVKVEKPKQIQLSENSQSDLRLLSPWAPKPLQKAPRGWRYVPVSADRSYPLDIKLSSGKSVSLSITPYALVPQESQNVVQAREPGYQPEKGYQQAHSVTARLENTTQTLEQAASSLDESIKNLSALVNSLPK